MVDDHPDGKLVAETEKKIRIRFGSEVHFSALARTLCDVVEDNPDLTLHNYFGSGSVNLDPRHAYISGENIHYSNTVGGLLHQLLMRMRLTNLMPGYFYELFDRFLKIETSTIFPYSRNRERELQFIERLAPMILLSNEYKRFPCVPFFVARFPDFTDTTRGIEKTAEDVGDLTKRKFCAFIYSNVQPVDRIRFFKKLSKYKKIDSFGKVLKNCDFPEHTRHLKTNDPSICPLLYKDYKFAICFENSFSKGYITEKLPHAMLANSIPVYRGAPDVGEYFNTDSFINYDDCGSYDRMIEKIVELDNDDEKYEEFLRRRWRTERNNENVKMKEIDFLTFLEGARDAAQNSIDNMLPPAMKPTAG